MFARNNQQADRRNGMVATVVGVYPAHNEVRLPLPNGLEQGLNLNRLAERHVRQGWVQTVHSSQVATADRVLAHMESFRRPVDARALYVAVSRACDQAHLYTDDRDRLTAAIGLRDGSQIAALDHEAGFKIG